MILFNSIFPKGSPLKDLTVYTEKVKFVNLGDTLLYDTQESIEWIDPHVDVTYKTELKASGETVMPFFDVYQELKRKGFSGKIYNGNTYYDYSIDYSIISDNSAFTLDTKTGNVTCTNNTTTSTRTFQIKATVTMTDSGISKDILVTFTQAKGVQSQSYSAWTTTGIILSADYTSFSAASSGTPLTTQLVERRTLYTYWNDKLYDSSDEYEYTTVTPTYSDDSGWISISGSYASISANEKGSYRTGTITATYNGYTDEITISQDADYATGYSYSTYISGFSYSDSYAYSGSSSTPSGDYTQTYYRDYKSGAWDVVSRETGYIGDSYCTFSGSSSYASLNSSTGEVTWNSANETSNNRSIYVTVTVNRNGQTETDSAYCYQRYDRSDTSTSRDINFSASPNPISAAGGEVILTCTGTTTTTTTWESGKPGSTTTSSFTPSISNTSQPSGFRRSGTTVTVGPNTNTSSRSAKYTASYSGATSKTVTITQEADSSWTTTEYDYRCGIDATDYTSSSSACPSSGGTTTLIYYADYRTRTVTHYTSGKASSYGSWSNWKSASSSEYSITGGAQTGFSRSGDTVTIAKKTTSGQRSTTYKITYYGLTDTVTIYQDGYSDYIVDYGVPQITIGSGMSASGGKATVTVTVINTYASGKTEYGSYSGLKIRSNGNNNFSLSGTKLTHGNMGTNTSETVVVEAYNAKDSSKVGTATETITNSVVYSTVQGINLSSFRYPDATTSANYSISPSIGNVTVSLQDTYQSGSTGSTYSVYNVTAYTKKFAIGSIQYFSIDTSSGKCTTKSANSSSSIRSTTVTLTITLTGDYQGTKTASFNTTIYQAATTNYEATICYTPPSDSEGWIITNSTITPTCRTGFAEQGSRITIGFKPGASLAVHNYQGNIGKVAIGSEAYVYVYVDGEWNLVGSFTHKNENYTVYI